MAFSWRLLVVLAAIAPAASHSGPLLRVSRLHHVPSPRQQLLATAAAPRRSVRTTKQVLEIGGLFSACTLLSLLSDTLTKKILQRDRSLTTTVTFFHFAMSALGGIFVVLLPMLLRAPPEDAEAAQDQLPPLRPADIGALLPLAICQALGFLTTNLSLRYVPVSFSHTIKACECLFTAAMSFAILRQAVSLPKYLSLLPVAGGVALSSFTEQQFSTAGFAAAMASNMCFASRSVLTTRLFRRRDVSARTLYWLMCCGALLLLSPLFARQISLGAILARGGAGKAVVGMNGIEPAAPLAALALCGLAHFSYNLLSFMILQRTTPITHVILHAVRRMLVIGVSSAMLRNRITYLNWAGILVAFMGVLGYTLSDRLSSAAPQARDEV